MDGPEREGLAVSMFQMGRVWGHSIEEALEHIHELHGPGTISIREFRARADGGVWFEYAIDLQPPIPNIPVNW